MGSYSAAEIYGLVGLYILSILAKVYGIQNVGLCRDHSLACLHKWTIFKKNTERYDQDFPRERRLENNYHNKFKNS